MSVNDGYTSSRENRSSAEPALGPDLIEEMIQARKDKRAKSIKEYHDSLGNKIREKSLDQQRSVSFSGVNVMVDAALEIYRGLSREENKLDKAVENVDTDLIWQLIETEAVTLECVIATSIMQDNDVILEQLLTKVGDVNLRMKAAGLTMLHLAAKSGSIECANLLLHHGGDPNAWDTSGSITPLHSSAASLKSSVDLIQVLVRNGGDLNSGFDKNGGSVLHFAILADNTQMVRFLLVNKVKTEVTEIFHETPLHTAAENNCIEIVEILLESDKSNVNRPKNAKDQETALHISAEAGYIEICQALIRNGADVSMVNGQYMTPLHLAARSLHNSVLELLLEHRGFSSSNLANMLDNQGRSALFVCTASKGRGATDCMRTLIRFGANPDIQNQDGFSPLHVAAIDRKPSRLNLLISSGADLGCRNNAGFSALHFINKKVPHCIKTLEDRLDAGIKLENLETITKIKIDFNKLSPDINNPSKQDITIFTELLKSQFQSLLEHPLSQAFLYLKWNQIKYLHLFLVIFSHFIYSTVYTVYALLIFSSICQPEDSNGHENRYKFEQQVQCDLKDNPTKVLIARISWIFLIFFTFFYLIKETTKVLTIPKRYISKWDSYIDMALIVSFFLISVHSNPFAERISVTRWQFHAAAVGCFLTWLQMMFYIGKLPRFGKYVQMFRVVATGVLHLMVAYSPLIIAFAASFMILFPSNEAFSHFNFALIKLFVMMLGEIDYEDLYYPQKQIVQNLTEIVSQSEHQAFPGTAHFLVLLFIFLASIILMNLLVGLAVSDIQGLAKSAKLNQLIQQVELIHYMEGWLSNPLLRFAPIMMQKYLMDKLHGLQGQNYNMVYTVKPLDTNDRLLPEALKRSLHENCLRRQSQSRDISRQAALVEMQNNIQKIFCMLGEKASKSSRILTSNTSCWQVEDDFESDNEDAREMNTLAGIAEESESIWSKADNIDIEA